MKLPKEPLILESEAPITSNGSEYNILLIIGTVAGLAIGLLTGPGAVLFAVFGLVISWALKDSILRLKCSGLRDIKFILPRAVPYSVLTGELTRRLTPMGLTVETDKHGKPVIKHKDIIFDIIYNDDNTFTIWWRKSIAKAIFTHSHAKKFRNCVISMGIIAYNIQQISLSKKNQEIN